MKSRTKTDSAVSDIIKMEVSSLKPGQLAWKPGTTNYEAFLPEKTKPKFPHWFGTLRLLTEALLLTAFLGSFMGLIAAFLSLSTLESQTYFTGAVVGSGLLSITAVKLPRFLREWAALTLLLVPCVFAFGVLQIPVSTIALPAAILGVIIGFMSRSTAPLIASAVISLGLAYYVSPLDMDFAALSALGGANFKFSALEGAGLTALTFILVGLASQHKGRILMTLALASLYAWGAIWLWQSGLSQRGITAFAFIAGAAQYKLGKAGLDDKAFASWGFIVCGWIIASAAYILLQSGYLDPEISTTMNVGQHPSSSITWIIGVGCALSCILVAGMSRHAHSRQTALSIFLTTIALGLVPFLTFRPDLILPYMSEVPGLQVIPTIGLIMGAAGLIVSTVMILNGLRLKKNVYVLLGLLTLGAQLVMLFDPSLFNIDNLVIFGTAFLASGIFVALTIRNKAQN